jgi:hypothetical protein
MVRRYTWGFDILKYLAEPKTTKREWWSSYQAHQRYIQIDQWDPEAILQVFLGGSDTALHDHTTHHPLNSKLANVLMKETGFILDVSG